MPSVRQRAATVASTHRKLASSLGGDLSFLNDDFQDSSLDEKWIQQPTGCVAWNSLIESSGYLDLRISNGGSIGSLWDNRNDGSLLAQLVTGDFDARGRFEARNVADSGPPNATATRVIGLAAHDPDRSGSFYNYVQCTVGVINGISGAALWGTTDDIKSGSATTTTDPTFATTPTTTDGGASADLRIVRVGQVFSLYEKTSLTALDSDLGWNLLQVVDRSDNSTPVRQGNGIAVPLPDTVQLGICVYATTITSDLRGRCYDFQVRSP